MENGLWRYGIRDKGHPFMTSTKKNKLFDNPPAPPLSTTVQFEGAPLPETDCGHPNFY